MAYVDLENSEARLVALHSEIPAAANRHADLMNQRAALNELIALTDALGRTELQLREIGAAD
jgi:hypothetical protein